MRIGPLPKAWLIHAITYTPPAEKDDWGNQIDPKPVTMEFVRFDDSTVFSRDNTQTKILADAIIFVDATHSTNIPDKFVQESKITFKGKDYTLKKDVPCYYPNKDEVRHWELEVI